MQKTSVVAFKSESNAKYAAPRAPEVKDVLAKAVDWKMQFDITAPAYDQSKERMFPAEILVQSGKRPDGVIWSCSSRTVIWLEVTSPWEENVSMQHELKKSRYNQLRIDCEAEGWEVFPLCVEVGCRGNVAESFSWMCKVLGFTAAERRDLKYVLERTAQHCSHAIFAHRFRRKWEPKPLLDVSKWDSS